MFRAWRSWNLVLMLRFLVLRLSRKRATESNECCLLHGLSGQVITLMKLPPLLMVLITFRVSRRPREMYCGHARLCVRVCVSVCLSVRGRMPTLLHGPGCNLSEW